MTGVARPPAGEPGKESAGDRASRHRASDRRAEEWLARIWAMVDGDPRLPGQVRLTGADGLLPAVYDVEALATASVAAATLAVAELGARRSGSQVPDVAVDRLAAAAAFRSEALLSPQGWQLPAPWDPIAGDYRAVDGWIRLHTNYAWHRAAALRALGLSDGPGVTPDQVAERVRSCRAGALERAVVAAGGCAAELHRVDAWAAHPHGSVAVRQPAVRLTRELPGGPGGPVGPVLDGVGPGSGSHRGPGTGRNLGSDVRPDPGDPPYRSASAASVASPASGSGVFGASGSGVFGGPGSGVFGASGSGVFGGPGDPCDPGQPGDLGQPGDPAAGPLAGIRVLDLTRVISGPVCTRTLAAWGADVLRIDPPRFTEVPALLPETTTGKRCATLDLASPGGLSRFAALVAQADVLVHGLRPGALDRLGLDDAQLRRLNPDLCIAALDAYGWDGPWAGRRGFDSLVQFSCGIAAAGAAALGSDRPVPLPAQALDHATGYLLAAAVCRGLTGRLEGLPPARIRASLVGTANLLMSSMPDGQAERSGEPARSGRAERSGEPARRGPAGVRDATTVGSPAGMTAGEGRSTPDLTRVTRIRDTAWGPVRAVAQPGTIGGVEGAWRLPAGPLGRHAAAFGDR